MNAAVKWDKNDYHNLGRILQLALNGWVRPSDDQLYGAGDYADVWSSYDGDYLGVDANGGDVYHFVDRECGHSVRLLDTK